MMQKNSTRIIRLTDAYSFKSFDCRVEDLNESMFLTDSRTGCAFVTVDALKCAIPFYLNNGFKFLDRGKIESTDPTCPLYYDLSQLLS